MENDFDIRGKVVVVTGGTGVLGNSLCRHLAAQGARVMILGRDENRGKALESDIIRQGFEAWFLQTDVLNIPVLEGNYTDIMTRYEIIDVLINAAGGNSAGATVTPDQSFLDLDMNELRQVIDLNLYGTIYPVSVFAKVMIERKEGVILNFTSATVNRPMTRVVGYSAAKSAIQNFTKWLAVEFSQKYGDKLRVNAISPGFFLTEQNRSLLTNSDGTSTERGKKILAATPFGRLGEAKELHGAIQWLCSDASRFVTGQTIVVDGGFDAFSGV
jgi:NAD(P)-dependent dehydrogenase (short-subunit alcohol dehydrogenase family)